MVMKKSASATVRSEVRGKGEIARPAALRNALPPGDGLAGTTSDYCK